MHELIFERLKQLYEPVGRVPSSFSWSVEAQRNVCQISRFTRTKYSKSFNYELANVWYFQTFQAFLSKIFFLGVLLFFLLTIVVSLGKPNSCLLKIPAIFICAPYTVSQILYQYVPVVTSSKNGYFKDPTSFNAYLLIISQIKDRSWDRHKRLFIATSYPESSHLRKPE